MKNTTTDSTPAMPPWPELPPLPTPVYGSGVEVIENPDATEADWAPARNHLPDKLIKALRVQEVRKHNRPELVTYKHAVTRRTITLDSTGNCWRVTSDPDGGCSIGRITFDVAVRELGY